MKHTSLNYRLSLLITSVALLILSYSYFQAKLNLNGYGLINSLPISYFVGLACLVIAASLLWVSEEKYTGLLILQTIILVISLFLTPYLLEGTPRFPAAYQNYGFVDALLRTGHLNPQTAWYHSYPGFSLYFSSFLKFRD